MKALNNRQRSLDNTSRRRNLFPSDENSIDSGLDCVSIDFDYNNEIDENRPPLNHNTSISRSDYDIIGVLVKSRHCCNTKDETPEQTKSNAKAVLESPTKKLKTPHEDLVASVKLPKLPRKQHDSPPAVLNSNSKNSKVRTALFPDLTLPTSTFYSKTTQNSSATQTEVLSMVSKLKKQNYKCKKTTYGRRNRFGQINAGVRHAIKKPKKSRFLSKEEALQKSLSIIENSPLNSFLESLSKEKPIDAYDIDSMTDEPERTLFRARKSDVNILSDIKLQVNRTMDNNLGGNGLKRTHESQTPENSKRLKLERELSFDESEPLIPNSQISNILNTLDDNKENNTPNADVLMSPNTSQMVDMASGLAINSPKKMKNLNAVLDQMPNNREKEEDTELKFFPLFYPGYCPPKKQEDASKPQTSKLRGTAPDQMQLDLGQRKFGAYQCPECKLLYDQGDPSEELLHEKYHNANYVFQFKGWKNERLVSSYLLDTRIIKILPHDPKAWLKKAQEVLEVVNRDLGYFDVAEFDLSKSQVYFYIKDKTIIGVLVAEAVTTAYKLMSSIGDLDFCSEESYPVKCGVSHFWVSADYRKQGIGTSLLNTLKRNFMFGYFLSNNDIAFSSPTTDGKLFAQAFFKTANFYIYFST